MKILIITLLVSISTISLSLAQDRVVKNGFKNHIYGPMCNNAKNVLNQLKKIDSGIDLEMDCTHEYTGKSMGVDEFDIIGSYSDNINRLCRDSDTYRVVKTPIRPSGTCGGTPCYFNPYLLHLLDKLGVEYKFSLDSVSEDTIKGSWTLMILYPSCS